MSAARLTPVQILAAPNSDELMGKFVTAVNDILPHASFRVFKREVKGSYGQETLDWTDLAAYQKRELLSLLPAR